MEPAKVINKIAATLSANSHTFSRRNGLVQIDLEKSEDPQGPRVRSRTTFMTATGNTPESRTSEGIAFEFDQGEYIELHQNMSLDVVHEAHKSVTVVKNDDLPTLLSEIGFSIVGNNDHAEMLKTVVDCFRESTGAAPLMFGVKRKHAASLVSMFALEGRQLIALRAFAAFHH